MPTLLVDIWSDIACPWCYIGKRHFEAALAQFPHRDDVKVTWHAFELDPSAPPIRDATMTHAERIAKKYRMPLAQAEAAIDNVVRTAAKAGLDFQFDKAQSGNTFDAHRVLHMAGERGVQDAMKERLLRAYFTEGVAVGDRDALATLAGEAGLDRAEVRAMLETSVYTEDVREDEEQAARLGISGVPFFIIGGKYAISGAQPASVLLGALEKGWNESAPQSTTSEGAVCGPLGCD